jgi:hypothetical protein
MVSPRKRQRASSREQEDTDELGSCQHEVFTTLQPGSESEEDESLRHGRSKQSSPRKRTSQLAGQAEATAGSQQKSEEERRQSSTAVETSCWHKFLVRALAICLSFSYRSSWQHLLVSVKSVVGLPCCWC